jgi:hypothetical protein
MEITYGSVCSGIEAAALGFLHCYRQGGPGIGRLMPRENKPAEPLQIDISTVTKLVAIHLPTAGQRANVIPDRVESHNSLPVWVPSQLALILRLFPY